MHVDHSLWRPHPIMFRKIPSVSTLQLNIFTVFYFDIPLNPGEIYPPEFSISRNFSHIPHSYSYKWDKHFDSPALIDVIGVVQSSLNVDSGFHTGSIVCEHCSAAIAVGFGHKKIKNSIHCIDFNLVIAVSIIIRIDENFKVVIIKNNVVVII